MTLYDFFIHRQKIPFISSYGHRSRVADSRTVFTIVYGSVGVLDGRLFYARDRTIFTADVFDLASLYDRRISYATFTGDLLAKYLLLSTFMKISMRLLHTVRYF